MTAPTVPAPRVSASSPPWWLLKAFSLVPLVGAVITYFDPDNKIQPGAVQAAVILGLVLFTAVIVLVDEILKNGMSKAGLAKTVTEEEAWIKDNYAEIRSTFEAAKPALDALPGVPAALAAAQGEVSNLARRFDSLPPAQQFDLDQVATLAKDKLVASLGTGASPLSAGVVPVATAETPLPASPTPPVPGQVV
jgi:hypothetical protein